MIEKEPKSIAINEKELFIKYLNDYKAQKKVIGIAEKIDFEGIYALFDKNFERLWKKIAGNGYRKNLIHSNEVISEKILTTFRQSIFNILYLGIKDLGTKGLDYDELNSGIVRDFEMIMYNLFKVFEMFVELTIPGRINNEDANKIVKREIEVNEADKNKKKKEKQEKPIVRIKENKYRTEEMPVYENVIKKMDELNKKGKSTTLRKVAVSVAEKEMEMTDRNELQLFYKRFVNYKKKLDKGLIKK